MVFAQFHGYPPWGLYKPLEGVSHELDSVPGPAGCVTVQGIRGGVAAVGMRLWDRHVGGRSRLAEVGFPLARMVNSAVRTTPACWKFRNSR